MQQAFHHGDSLWHILLKSRYGDCCCLVAYADAVRTCNVIEISLYLLQTLLVCAEEVHVAGCDVIAQVCQFSEVEAIGEEETVIRCVLLVYYRESVLGGAEGQFLVEVDELWLYVFHLLLHEVRHELTAHIAVAGYRCNLRLVNLYYRGVFALTFVEDYVSIGDMFLCPRDDVSLCEFAEAVQLGDVLFPRHVVDEAVNHLAYAADIAVEALQL